MWVEDLVSKSDWGLFIFIDLFILFIDLFILGMGRSESFFIISLIVIFIIFRLGIFFGGGVFRNSF